MCASADPRDKRLRTSAWIETDCGESILIDCGPDFRQQVLSLNHFSRISAVLLTHEHYDHVGGIDDLRPFCVFGEIPVYGDAICLEHQRERMPYCFAEHRYPGVPKISLHPVRPGEVFRVGKQEILPFVVMHAQLPIMGYRFGRTAYITDMKTIPDESLPLWKVWKRSSSTGCVLNRTPAIRPLKKLLLFRAVCKHRTPISST